MENRKKVIISFNKMGDALMNQLSRAFPMGFEENLITISYGPDKNCKGLVWDTGSVTYLVKFDKNWQEAIENGDEFDDEEMTMDTIDIERELEDEEE